MTMTAAKPVPDVGDVHVIQEDQYKFGLGPILVRGVSVKTGVVFDNAQWWTVQAEVADGTHAHHGNWILREIYVTDSALETIHGQSRMPIPHAIGNRGHSFPDRR
jgi:hypothetical protein